RRAIRIEEKAEIGDALIVRDHTFEIDRRLAGLENLSDDCRSAVLAMRAFVCGDEIGSRIDVVVEKENDIAFRLDERDVHRVRNRWLLEPDPANRSLVVPSPQRLVLFGSLIDDDDRRLAEQLSH